MTAHHLSSLYSHTHTVPIVITLITKNGASEQLKNRVQQQMASLSEQFGINISAIEVDRFGIFILCNDIYFSLYQMDVQVLLL